MITPSTRPDQQDTAARRWRRLVRARLAETKALSGSADVGAAFWDPRARRFARRTAGTAEGDPLLARVRGVAGFDTDVLDVGCGPGRFALALAPGVARVVGVDPSPVMLTLLRRQARRQGLGNVTTMTGRWQDVEIGPFDVGLCSYVLPLIEDARTFLAKLDAACRDHAFVYLSAMSTDAVFDPFWRHFHGAARNPGPTYLDAVAVLAELGIRADVEVVELPLRTRFTTVAAAARDYRENLLLPDIPEVRKELRALLSTWLVTSDGSLRPPLQTTPAAILHWQPSRRRGRP
ncbi:MAG: class I SAM-dependent methyltransferase [Actinomycetota bacterium]|nr:class I SAM-dependent methyltransferase [Actinomycetota bacterium]